MKKIIDVVFKDSTDFRNRIAKLWQNQEQDEEYNFIFLDKETEEEFDKLMSKFLMIEM